MLTARDDTSRVVELTPPGRAAVAVVAASGRRAMLAVGECFRPAGGRRFTELPIGRISFGRWCGPEGEELIVCRRSEEEVEIHCHGGMAAVGAIIDRLVERGCRRVTWQDWVRAAGDGDAVTRSAHIALAEATTERVAGMLLDQYHGALSREIGSGIAAIARADWTQAAEILDEVLRFGKLGLHLTKPWRVVLAGTPNVGKSSLINAMAGFERTIVSPRPGTTRDVVTTITAIDGWPVQLADTAGLRESSDTLETAGIALTADAVAGADLVIAVEDVSRERDGFDAFACVPPHVPILHVANKVDLLKEDQRNARLARASIASSAVTGEGIADLLAAVAATLVPVAPAAGVAVPFTKEQVAKLESARRAIGRGDGPAAETALNALVAGDCG